MKRFATIVLVVFSVSLFGTAVSDAKSSKNCQQIPQWSYTDSTLSGAQFDPQCRELFIEAPPRNLASSELLHNSLVRPDSSFNPTSAFSLHSNPSAPAIIYLDFDGQLWQEGSWWLNSIGIEVGRFSPGFTLDDNPLDFSIAERNAIYEVWINVAEDFAMFNVDVTTERPTGVRENIFKANGSHALILSDDVVQTGCGCGGIAYVDVFGAGNAWQYPALNFSKFGNYFAPAWDVAEIISHEVGHNLGLAHDGTTTGIEYYSGHSMWTPIMGAGRGRGIATWSYGGYPNADTRWDQPRGDDDFSQMRSYLNQLTDDFGDSQATAASLNEILDETVDDVFAGKITTSSDIDVFRIDVDAGTSGIWEFDLDPVNFGVNLDPLLVLRDGLGNVLDSSNPSVPAGPFYGYPPSGLDALIRKELEVGTYFLSVEGVGQGSLAVGTGYDDYASLGNFTIKVERPSLGVRVQSVSPTSGGPGVAVAVQGNGLTQVTSVRLSGQEIEDFSIINSNLIVFGLPTGSISGPLTLQANGLTYVATNNFLVSSRNASVTISTVAPNVGSPGKIITINGTNIGATKTLAVGTRQLDFEVTGKNSLTFMVPDDLESGKITVSTSSSTASSKNVFKVNLPPRISSVLPQRSYVGATITLQGSNFTTNTVVFFADGVRATKSSTSANQITVTVPKKAKTGPISVQNSLGSSRSEINFEVIPAPPQITKVSPTSARAGVTVTISGKNFVDVVRVELAGRSVEFRRVSASQIKFVVPIGSVTGKVSVITPGGTAESEKELEIR